MLGPARALLPPVAGTPAGRARRGRVRVAAPDLGSLDAGGRHSTERQVYERVKQAIMAGVFAPGAGLSSRALADSFGVSPMPVREALKRLEAHGVLASRQKSAYFVTVLPRESYLELVEVRARIEGYATAAAAPVIRPETISRLEALNAAYAAVGAHDVAAGLRLNHAFHFTIYHVAASPMLIELIENCWLRVGPALHYHLAGYDAARVTDTHARLIDALRRGDGPAAEKMLRRDLTEAAKVIAPHLPVSGGPAAQERDETRP